MRVEENLEVVHNLNLTRKMLNVTAITNFVIASKVEKKNRDQTTLEARGFKETFDSPKIVLVVICFDNHFSYE